MDLIFGLILVDALVCVLIIFLMITNSVRHKEIGEFHAELLLRISRYFQDAAQNQLFNQDALLLRLRQIEENTRALNFKTQLIEMRMDEQIKTYTLTPAPIPATEKFEKVIQRRRRARSKKKPPNNRGPKDILV